MSSNLPIEELGAKIQVQLHKSDDYLVSAGLGLIEAQERIKSGREKVSWSVFLASHCGISKSRAHELMRIAGGRTTVEATRKRAREGMRDSRAKAKAKTATPSARPAAEAARRASPTSVRNVTDADVPKTCALGAARAAADALSAAFAALSNDERRQFRTERRQQLRDIIGDQEQHTPGPKGYSNGQRQG
jgi:hypothetical protein